MVYASLLGNRLRTYQAKCWLVNTGWSGGPYGVGSRMKISYTRAMIDALLTGALDEVEYEQDPVFGGMVPCSCPGVLEEILKPRNTWEDQDAYDQQAHKLAAMFIRNFEQFADGVPPEVLQAGPNI